ncbi:hypothetical protein OUZ56_005990 [Daphnia magna]|uniref:Uncharacterized protein n=1 Tax=Daphnia magna TaxID=35525 RepID=A0ABQ9YUY4_9CRUS|nr:hypothetical protein OUZ56_005990 [Daphnia magna]
MSRRERWGMTMRFPKSTRPSSTDNSCRIVQYCRTDEEVLSRRAENPDSTAATSSQYAASAAATSRRLSITMSLRTDACGGDGCYPPQRHGPSKCLNVIIGRLIL